MVNIIHLDSDNIILKKDGFLIGYNFELKAASRCSDDKGFLNALAVFFTIQKG